MSTLTEMIVYIWLIPVVLQLALPLAVLGIWMVTRLPFKAMGGSKVESASPATA